MIPPTVIPPTFHISLILAMGMGGCVSLPTETFIYLPPKVCPTEDHGGWFKTNNLPADRIEWLASPEAHRVTCTSSQPCASIGWEFLRDGELFGRVWSSMPPYLYSPTLVQHELCHTQGWNHGRHVQYLWSPR